jgi:NAD(P)-dependent dehydrogenase (short-subunit alcohol dehydrogenase family)
LLFSEMTCNAHQEIRKMSDSHAEARMIALVTGAAQGIGLGIARSLALASYKVVLGDIEDNLLDQAAAQLRTQGLEAAGDHLDVTSADDWGRVVSALVARWGGLDLLVNCAGISPRGTVETTDEALWDQTLAINLKGAWLGIKAAIPALRRRRGTIINIGSTRATRPMPGLFSYVVSKAGLWGLTQQVAVEYLAEGITCNMIAPGWVDTPNERLIQARFGRPDFPAGIRNLTTPQEVGAAVLYLASVEARKINGVILYLDAGLQIADDAGMVYLPDRSRPPYEQRIAQTKDEG